MVAQTPALQGSSLFALPRRQGQAASRCGRAAALTAPVSKDFPLDDAAVRTSFATPTHETIEGRVVAFKRSTIRIVALLILMPSGVETVMCDVVSHKGESHITNAGSSDQQSDEDCGCSDGCLCCCAHAIPTVVVSLANVERFTEPSPDVLPLAPSTISLRIYHPPKA